jgi:prefoldin alpha subunit
MTESENSEQELMIKFRMFEQQIQLVQEQIQAVEQGIMDLNNLNIGLDELIGKADSEILAPIGRGIYAKAKLMSETLLVDVGGGNFVKKTIPDTKKILDNQIKKLEEIKKELNSAMEKINEEITKTFVDNKK